MLTVNKSNSFNRDVSKMAKWRKCLLKRDTIVIALTNNTPLPARTRPHKLTGNWADHWECHIEPDWLLIYRVSDTELALARTGSRADLFE